MTAAALSKAEKLARLQLARTPRIGPVTFAQLLERFGTAERAIEALPDMAQRTASVPLRLASREACIRELTQTRDLGGRIVVLGDDDYPAPLAAIDAPPPTLSVLGDLSLFSKPMLGMVGARNASAVGRQLARRFAKELGQAGYVIVSGLARGIDGAAHEGSLATGTIAVVAGGLDHVYPREHADLREQIIGSGSLLTERAFGATPSAQDFPRRNRLISGLSRGVIVIEAAERSGSLVTARYAAEQGREVMAVPGSPLDPRAQGANKLLQQGAALVQSSEDVIAVVAGLGHQFLENEFDRFSAPAQIDEDALPNAVVLVRQLLSPMPVHRDVLIRESGLSAGLVSGALLELDIAGTIEQEPGGYVRLRTE